MLQRCRLDGSRFVLIQLQLNCSYTAVLCSPAWATLQMSLCDIAVMNTKRSQATSGCSGKSLFSLIPGWLNAVSNQVVIQFQCYFLLHSGVSVWVEDSAFGWLLVILVECQMKFNLTTLKSSAAFPSKIKYCTWKHKT